MAAIVEPDEEELYLLAILLDDTGIDIAEFMFLNEENEHGRFRCYDYQFSWWADEAPQQIDQSGRALGKSWGIQIRACAFPFSYPDQDMLLTAPELNHLRPLVDAVESRLLASRIMNEMLPDTKGKGIARQPHWQVRFRNGAKIVSRLPGRDGKGVKGQHVIKLEIDEAQDYPLAGWIEIVECLNRGSVGAQWRVHGVSRGVRDKFWEYSQSPSWSVHRKMAMNRPSWAEDEREDKITTYGGSRQNPDYKRNIYGEHGDATNPLFVLARLMACFRAGTPVWTPDGPIPIEDVRVCDRVLNAVGASSIVSAVRTVQRDVVVAVTLDDGEELVCSPEHPFFTLRGWENADGLVIGDQLVGQHEVVRGMWEPSAVQEQEVLWAQLHREVAGQYFSWQRDPQADVHDVRVVRGEVLQTVEGDPVLREPVRGSVARSGGEEAGAEGLRVVRSGVSAGPYFSSVLHKDVSSQVGELPAAREADMEFRYAGATATAQDRARGVERGSVQPLAGAGLGVAPGVLDRTLGGDPRGGVVPDRPSSSAPQGGCGMRRAESSSTEHDRDGSDTRRLVGVRRVVGVEVLQPGDPGWVERCGDGDTVTLYDLTVTDHPSFAVGESGVLVHNCVDQNQGSEYNQEVYAEVKISFEELQGRPPIMLLDGKLNGMHKVGWSGAPKGYSAYYGGMDVGATIDPSEILVFGQRAGSQREQLDLLTRVQMQRISLEDQEEIVNEIIRFYGTKMVTFSIDRTGLGFDLYQRLHRFWGEQVKGYNFSGKYAVGLEDRELEEKEVLEDLVIERNIVEFASDALREVVDAKGFTLPFDRELLTEWQGQSYVITKSKGAGPYGTRKYSEGSFHTLDAGKMMIAGKRLHTLDEILNAKQQQAPVMDVFLGAY